MTYHAIPCHTARPPGDSREARTVDSNPDITSHHITRYTFTRYTLHVTRNTLRIMHYTLHITHYALHLPAVDSNPRTLVVFVMEWNGMECDVM